MGTNSKKHHFTLLRVFSIFLALALILSLSACTQEKTPPPSPKPFTKAQLEADFMALQETIDREHPKLYTDKAALKALYLSQLEIIRNCPEGMTQLEFLRVLAPIVAKLNCGHSSIMLSDEAQRELDAKNLYFPLPLRFIGDGVYIAQNRLVPQIPPGSQLLSIDGQPMGKIKDRLFSNLGSDGQNETHKIMLLNTGFSYYYQVFIGPDGPDGIDSHEFTITYQTASSNKSRVTETLILAAVSNADLTSAYQANAPQWVPYAMDFTPDYGLLTMSSFYPAGAYTLADYKAFIDDFFSQVAKKNIQNVILDVRGNGGGDPLVTSHLFNYLAKTPQPYFNEKAMDYYKGLKSIVPLAEPHFTGNLYVLMDGGSFSSTGHLLALLKYQGVGTMIGEESGASFACTDASRVTTLPNTKLRYHGATRIWEIAMDPMDPGAGSATKTSSLLVPGRGVMPDHTVVQDIGDYLSGTDTQLEYAKKMFNH